MDNIIKSAPSYSGISDSAYDRNEDAEAQMQSCDHCNGDGVIYYCGICDEERINCNCIDDQNIKSEHCTHCDGEGEIEI